MGGFSSIVGVGAVGLSGPEGPPGEGVPAGGTTGQILQKASDADYDTEWVSPAPLEPERGVDR